jgi:site-specific recombinase XerD
MHKIKNVNYRNFLDNGEIEIINIDMLTNVLKKITGIRGSFVKQARALIIFLYYTGARPVESFKVLAQDVYKDKSYCVIKVKGAKRGKTRPIYLSFKSRHIKELYDYAMSLPPNMYLFYNFKGSYTRRCVNKKTGETYYREEVSDKLRYHFKKWFKDVLPGGVTTYYLRHNIFSMLMMRGADERDIKNLKGAKTLTSVDPYIHLSSKKAKRIARLY